MTNQPSKKERAFARDNRIDLLRSIGLSLIILAHVLPPPLLFNLRTFDVPLMVFVSGLTCYGKELSYSWKYLFRRFARLVFPVWIFLTIYFVPIVLLRFIGIDLGLNFRHVWGSFLLLDGIGYVWIIRVFLLIAMITPLLIKFNKAMRNQFVFTLTFSLFLCCYLLITYLGIGTDISIVSNWLYYIIGYGFLFLLGVRIKDFSRVGGMVFFSVMLLLFTVQAFVDVHQIEWTKPIILHINDFKYPPTNVFMLYGLIMSVVVYAIVYLKRREHLNPIVRFVGCNSIWIYLWHIPFVAVTAKMDMEWWIRYVAVYVCALLVYSIQLLLLKKLKARFNYRIFNYLEG